MSYVTDPTKSEMHDPVFLEWLARWKPIVPDEQDLDWAGAPVLDAEYAQYYRWAQARKILRLWQVWKEARE